MCKVQYGLQKERGYCDLQDVIAKNETLSAGDKVYAVNKEKAVVLYHIGKEPLEKGMNILGAHIDSHALILSRCRYMKILNWY